MQLTIRRRQVRDIEAIIISEVDKMHHGAKTFAVRANSLATSYRAVLHFQRDSCHTSLLFKTCEPFPFRTHPANRALSTSIPPNVDLRALIRR